MLQGVDFRPEEDLRLCQPLPEMCIHLFQDRLEELALKKTAAKTPLQGLQFLLTNIHPVGQGDGDLAVPRREQ